MSWSRQCANEKCSRLSRALCNCCEKYLCLDHLKDHADKLNEELTPISDRFNQLAEKLNNISFKETSFIKQLNKWSYQAHQCIDDFYQVKRNEFEIYFQKEKQKQENQFSKIKEEFREILHQQEATKENIQLLNNILKSIEEQIYFIENPDFILIPLIINDDTCIIKSKTNIYRNLLPLSLPYKIITKKETSCYPIAANEENILICQSSKLCLLNREMEIDKQIPWLYGHIYDMCFSTILQQFIILTNKYRFNLDQKTMNFTKYSIFDNDIKKIQGISYSGTCFNEYLFLSTNNAGTSIYQYKIFPSNELFKEWISPISCEKDLYIDHLRSNKIYLAIIISNKIKEEIYFELRLPTTFEKQWIFNISSTFLQERIRCSSIQDNQWLICDTINSSLLHIDQNGKLIKQEKYHPSPHHILQLDTNLILISTETTFHLHQLL